MPVIEAVAASGIRVSVDTRKASVAKAAVKAGATLINDVSAALWPVAAEEGVGWVAMHMRGEPRTMQVDPHYDDVVTEVRDFLIERATRATAAGVSEVWIDPGIGFGKTQEHNLQLLRHLDRMVESVARHGGEPGCCGTCLDARGIGGDHLTKGARRSTLDELADWTTWADKVVTF